ncbi:MAG: hypothetical protein ACREOI_31960, partial [bacterium]
MNQLSLFPENLLRAHLKSRFPRPWNLFIPIPQERKTMIKDARQFTGEENHAITTAEALTFIKQFREHFGPEAAPGVFFDKQAVQAILDQPHAVGMRYYYGADVFDQTQLVLVG